METPEAKAEYQELREAVTDAQILVTEGRRTLAQAREAVREADRSRGFYNPGKAWSPGRGKTKSPGKGKGKGKSKPMGKNQDGGCALCGRLARWWKNCSSHKGKAKGYYQDEWMAWSL